MFRQFGKCGLIILNNFFDVSLYDFEYLMILRDEGGKLNEHVKEADS